MVVEGVDYSWARPGGGDPGKVLTAGEIDDLHANGLGIVLVYESTAGRPTDGFGAGVMDAQIGLAAMRQLGFPEDRPLYFAVDFDAQPWHFSIIDAYLNGAIQVLGAHRVGVYGSYRVVKHCDEAGTARWFWQTYAWSGGQFYPGAHIYQYLNGQDLNGAVDYNKAFPVDYGQWGGSDFMAFLTEEQQRKLILRLFAGSERDGLNDDEKMAIAIAELEKGGTVQSVNDVAQSAIVVALDAHPNVPTDTHTALQAKVAAALAKAATEISGD